MVKYPGGTFTAGQSRALPSIRCWPNLRRALYCERQFVADNGGALKSVCGRQRQQQARANCESLVFGFDTLRVCFVAETFQHPGSIQIPGHHNVPHQPLYERLSVLDALSVSCRIIGSPRIRNDSRQKSGLVGAERRCRNIEIVPRRSLGSINAISPLDDIEIQLQNPALAQNPLELPRNKRLVGFPERIL